MPLCIELALSSSVSLEVYGSLRDALSGGSKLSSLKMKPGEMQPLYLLGPSEDK